MRLGIDNYASVVYILDMKNTGTQPIIGTLRSQGAKDREYVKKCATCGATLIVAKWEISKDRHEMCEEAK